MSETEEEEVPDETRSQETTKEETIEETTEETTDVIKQWNELKEIPIQDLFSKGWKPRVKTKPEGQRYITIRHSWKDSEKKWHDEEKSLGSYDPERWEALLSMYPKQDIFPKRDLGTKRASGILGTKIDKPLPSTVHLELETLSWYKWMQAQGYPGTLDQFINGAVDGYFREHHRLELAVIMEKEIENE